MKRNKLLLAALLVTVSSLAAPSASALTESETKAIQKAVTEIRVPERVSKAVQLVVQASAENKEAVALAAVEAILSKNPGSAPVLVGSISKAAPEISAAVAALAAQKAPDIAPAIAKAAATAAPAHAAKIAAAVAKKVSKRMAIDVASAVMNAVPVAAANIAAEVTAAKPEVKTEVARVRGNFAATHGGPIHTNPGLQSGQTPPNPPQEATSTPGFDPNRPYPTP